MNPNIYKSNVEEKDGKCSYLIQRRRKSECLPLKIVKNVRKTAARCAAKKNKNEKKKINVHPYLP